MLWAAPQWSGMQTSTGLHHASTIHYLDEQDDTNVNTVCWLTCLAPVWQRLLHMQQQTGQQQSPFHQAV